MKTRIIALIGLIGGIILAIWIYRNVGGGMGLMQNVSRNTILGVLLPWLFYFLLVIFNGAWNLGIGSSDKTIGDLRKNRRKK